jgi:hypothetical protein
MTAVCRDCVGVVNCPRIVWFASGAEYVFAVVPVCDTPTRRIMSSVVRPDSAVPNRKKLCVVESVSNTGVTPDSGVELSGPDHANTQAAVFAESTVENPYVEGSLAPAIL